MIGERRENLQRVASDRHLLFGREILKGAHIVQAVGELDNDNAHILRHGENDFA